EHTTDLNGETWFSHLPIGLYLVRETYTPEGHVGTAPFLLTLPLTTQPRDGDKPGTEYDWNYHLHVYPKNTILDVDKQLVSASVTAGGHIAYELSVTIPTQDGNNLVEFNILDQLDPELELIVDSVVVKGPVSTCDGEPAEYSASDYTDNSEYGVTGGKVDIAFTAGGLVKLNAVTHTSEGVILPCDIPVTITFQARTTTDGAVINGGEDWRNGGFTYSMADQEPVKVTWPETEVRYGGFRVVKTNLADHNPALLAGAQFRVFLSKQGAEDFVKHGAPDGGNPYWGDKSETEKAAAAPVSFYNAIPKCMIWDDDVCTLTEFDVDPVTIATTDKYGAVLINGLLYYADGTDYWLLEVKAPRGYELLAEPVSFTVTGQIGIWDEYNLTDIDALNCPFFEWGETACREVTSWSFTENPEAQWNLQLKNVKSNGGFQIPLTGGSGTEFLTLLGMAAFVALVIAISARKPKYAR
ncbi:MAG: SpaH/EbpB family LPXTG-anchored major pilin, partial [Promicromonosporaceae bacterium]|nr:SpaH/EbpB family LPXTG-anchored major pilin [Promicromonosporaceae bacterium]